MKVIGIRREDKNKWEARVPLVPADVAELVKDGVRIIVQPSGIRAFSDEEYSKVGAEISEDLSGADIIIGIKEMPVSFFKDGKAYMFFSHTIKGQEYNMNMLRTLMDKKCTLFDYERIVDEKDRRLIFFGKYAGIAGMIETLWTLGRRLEVEGYSDNPFLAVKQSYEYALVEKAEKHLREIGELIRTKGIPEELAPMTFGFTGYGNVSKGAQQVLDYLPVVEVTPEELKILREQGNFSNRFVYKTVFREEDMVVPAAKGDTFELSDYYQNPEKYNGVFSEYHKYLTVLVNAVYWDEKYPRIVDNDNLRKYWGSEEKPAFLKVIGDISCDIKGGVQATVKATMPDNPVYVYDPMQGKGIDGVAGNGPVIMAVDNLPCELPAEASAEFSTVLKRFVPELAKADLSLSLDKVDVSYPIKTSMIVHNGSLTPDYEYINDFLK